jgi:outer membrane protein assembly factor BamB
MRPRSRAETVFAAGIVFLAVAASAEDWPCFLGPQGNCSSPETGINKDWRAKPPKELWRVALTDNGYSCPSVAGGKVFIVDHKGASDIVRAFDLESGAELWRFAYADAAKNRNGCSYATPTCDEGLIYTLSKDGRLHCLDARDGKVVWRLNLVTDAGAVSPYWGYAAVPVVDGSKLLVVAGGGKGLLLALDKKTGEIVWRGGGTGNASYASPVIATIRGKTQYVVFGAKGLVGIDPDGGAALWEAPWDTKHDCHSSTPVVIGDRVFITSNYKRGCTLVEVGAAGTRRVWEHKNVQSHFTTPVLHEGRLYCTSDPGRLVCLDVASGEVVWSRKGFEKGGLCAVDGTLIVCDGKTGDVVMCKLTPDGYRELGRVKPLGGQSWPPPIVAHGRLIVRNRKAMVCLDLR